MNADDQHPTTAAEDLATEAVVLRLVLSAHPIILDLAELVREIAGEDADFGRRDAVERAVRDLGGVGLLHYREDLVAPTRAALRFNELAER